MRFKFADRSLEALYTTGARSGKFGHDAVRAFLRAMARIDAAKDERDLYAYKGLHYEKLKGNRSGQRSIRLNQQWRLILSLEEDSEGNYLWIIELVDYH
jgi:proteic killer suppression protein